MGNLKALEAAWSQRRPQVEAVPAHLELFFDEVCNLRCRMCTQRHRPATDMTSMEVVAAILREHKRIGRIYVSGGEPFHSELARSFFRECIRFHPHFSLFICTNISAADLRLIEHLNVSTLACSLSAGSKDTYELIHAGSNWELCLEKLRKLADLKKQRGNPSYIVINYVVFNNNIGEIPQAIELVEGMGLNIQFTLGVPPKSLDQWDIRNWRESSHTMAERIEILNQASAQTKDSYARGCLLSLAETVKRAENARSEMQVAV
jgi:molybdenum cofactor biosynthesis enzyme MoaA